MVFFSSPASNRSSSSLVGAERVGAEQLGILGQPQISTIWKRGKQFFSRRGDLTLPRRGCGGEESNPISISPICVVYTAAGLLLFASSAPWCAPPNPPNGAAASLAPWAGNFKGQVSKTSSWGSSVEPNGSGCSPEKRPVLARGGLRSYALMDGFSIL